MTNQGNASRSNPNRSVAVWTLLNAIILGASAWLALSSAMAPLASRAHAGPPEQSSLDKDRAAAKSGQADPFDPAARELELLAEVRTIRGEVAAIREMIRSGGAKVSIANMDEVKLEIDYKKLRDAMRAQ